MFLTASFSGILTNLKTHTFLSLNLSSDGKMGMTDEPVIPAFGGGDGSTQELSSRTIQNGGLPI